MHGVCGNTVIVARNCGICGCIRCGHLYILQFEIADAAAFESYKARLCGAAFGAGGRTLNLGHRRSFGPNASSGAGSPLSVNYHIAFECHGSINIIGAACHADDGRIGSSTACCKGKRLGKGLYRSSGRTVVAVVTSSTTIYYFCSAVGV